jgi:hypothetical protein
LGCPCQQRSVEQLERSFDRARQDGSVASLDDWSLQQWGVLRHQLDQLVV